MVIFSSLWGLGNKLPYFLVYTHNRFCNWLWKLVVLIVFAREQSTIQTVTGIFLHRRKSVTIFNTLLYKLYFGKWRERLYMGFYTVNRNTFSLPPMLF